MKIKFLPFLFLPLFSSCEEKKKPTKAKSVDRALIVVVKQDLRSLTEYLEAYQKIGKFYPTTEQGLEALQNRPTTAPRPRNWIRVLEKLPLDPWKNAYKYSYPGSQDPSKPEVISAGPDLEFGTEDDISNQGK